MRTARNCYKTLVEPYTHRLIIRFLISQELTCPYRQICLLRAVLGILGDKITNMLVSDKQNEIKRLLIKSLEKAGFSIINTEKDFVDFKLKHKRLRKNYGNKC